MFWYKGKRVTLDLVLGLTVGIMALGAAENPYSDRVVVDIDNNPATPELPYSELLLQTDNN